MQSVKEKILKYWNELSTKGKSFAIAFGLVICFSILCSLNG
jgi:hypothetical protein